MMSNLQSAQKQINDEWNQRCRSCVNHKTFFLPSGRKTDKMLSIRCDYGTPLSDTEGESVFLPNQKCDRFRPLRIELTDVLDDVRPELQRLRATGIPEPSLRVQIDHMLGHLCGEYSDYKHIIDALMDGAY